MSSGDLPALNIKMAEKERKIQPTAVPLDTLPERCTMTMRHPRFAYASWRWFCAAFRYLVPDLVYAENSDVICVNETWLNQSINNAEILHSGFTIFRRDRSDRGGGGVLIAIKTASFKAVKEFKPE